MEYQVILHKNDRETKYDGYETDGKYDGHIEIILTFNNQKIKWKLSDCGSYPSNQWVGLLNFMKWTLITNISPIIIPGGPSSWNAKVKNSTFELCFDVSGGDCSIIHEFSVCKMIPVIEEIVQKIKLME